MNTLSIQPHSRHPYIEFNPSTLLFRIGGESRPENTKAFYKPIIDWVLEFEQELIKTTNTPKQLTVEVEMHYFNSSSLKSIFEVLDAIIGLQKHNVKVTVKWFYEGDDEDMLESGESLEDMLEFQFEYVPR